MGVIVFVPSVSSQICKTGRTTSAADAAHCDGVGSESYGTTLKVVP